MERIGGEDTGVPSSIRKVVVSSFIGTTIEWYDYFIYGTAAALVFPALFFPDFSELAGTLLSFSTFAVGFAARPLGGIIFGHFGDRIGRKAMLVTTLLIMGVATFLVGCLPTFDQIGVWAPILLVVLRLTQGLGLGGEWGGAVLMSVEHSPPEQRGLNGSWPQMGAPAGLVLATGVFAAVSAITGDAFEVWGWRVPFLLSIILIGVGLFIRLRIYESPAFNQVRESGTEARMPIIDVLRTYPKNVALGVGSRIGIDAAFYILAVYSLTHISANLGLSPNIGLLAVSIAALIEIFTIPSFGSLSDRVGRKPLLIGGAALLGIWTFPFFGLLNTKSTDPDHPRHHRWALYRPRRGLRRPGQLLRRALRHTGALQWSLFQLPVLGHLRGRSGAAHRNLALPAGRDDPDSRLCRRAVRPERSVLRPRAGDLSQGHLRRRTAGTPARRRAGIAP